MGRLTTHVLDTANGCPAAKMRGTLFSLSGSERALIKTFETNRDGRCDQPLLEGEAFKAGVYELEFAVNGYFQAKGADLGLLPFLGQVPIRFAISDEGAHYHVPLLVSPWSYSTYRGS